jgi:Leucine-rich repeat (LRR) protein
MNRYLDDVEQPTATGTQLNRVESISAVARRRAVACVVQDDDDASGILEHNLPMISFQSTQSDDCILMMNDKLAAVGLDPCNNGLGSGDYQRPGNVCELPLFCEALDDSCSQLDEGESTTTRRKLEKSKSPSPMPNDKPHANSGGHLTPVLRDSQPGAYREGGSQISPAVLQRRRSEISFITTSTQSSAPEVQQEYLVNAELVTDHVESSTREKCIFVEALPLELDKRPTTSIMGLINTNRKVQVGMFSLVLAAVVVTMVMTMGRSIPAQLPTMGFTPSASPTTLQAKIVMDILELNLSPVSLSKVRDHNSPQNKAVRWLQKDSNVTSYNDERILQRYALATFYYSTGGPTIWINNDGWLGDNHECSWFTASLKPKSICHNGTLRHLNIMGNGLRGNMPEDISLLTDLVELTVEMNALIGRIPADGLMTLSRLEKLDLALNLLSGTIPTEIGLLCSLTELDLASNGLEGTLPSELGLLTNAGVIRTFQNFLNGTLPKELGYLTSMHEFVSWGNRLSGSLPTEVGNMISLTEFSLHTNMLRGTIPPVIGNLDLMEILELQRNKFTRSLPTEIGNMKHLTYFNVGDNRLTGTIPVEMMAASNLEFFSLYNNSVNGTIPTDTASMVNLREFYVDNNKLQGTIPSELGLLKKLENFWAAGNHLKGTVPRDLCNLQAVGGTTIVLDCLAVNCSCLTTTGL